MKILEFSIEYFLHKCAQVWRFRRICWHLLETSVMEKLVDNYFFCGVLLIKSNRVCGQKQLPEVFYQKSQRPATLLKLRLWHGCFPESFAKSLRTPFLQNTSRRLLLYGTKNCWKNHCNVGFAIFRYHFHNFVKSHKKNYSLGWRLWSKHK